jgi:ferredoxin, 2Fe-2S
MPTLTIIEFSGKEHRLDVPEGKSVMQAAVDSLIPGIMADCGGSCSCATCHCYVEAVWQDRLPAPGSAEKEMLDCALDPQPNSRLCCQLLMTAQSDGLVIRLPRSQV